MVRHPWSSHPRWAHLAPALGRRQAGWNARRVISVALSIGVVTAAALVIGLASGLVRPPAPAATPVPDSPVVRQVLSYALAWQGPAADPPITLTSGQTVKSSNYRGVAIDGVTYYYNLAPLPSFDPLARGEVTTAQVHVVAIVGDAPNRVMVYTVP